MSQQCPLRGSPFSKESTSNVFSSAASHIDVNAASVMEDPRKTNKPTGSASIFGDLFASSGAGKQKRVSTDIPLVVLREVSWKEFEPFISQLRTVRSRAGLAPSPALRDEEAAEAEADNVFNGTGSGGLFSSAGGFLPIALPSSTDTDASEISNQEVIRMMLHAQGSPDAFQTVPGHFFEPNFSLKKNNALDELLSWSRTRSLDEVQDRLASQLDSVECHLLAATRARSRQFFEALSQLQELRDRVLDANVTAKVLHRHIGRIKDESCIEPLNTIALYRRRRRKEQVRDMLKVMQVAAQAPANVGRLFHDGNLMGALEGVEVASHLISTQLPRVRALADVKKKLDHFILAVGNELVERFTRSAVSLATVGSTSSSSATANPSSTSTSSSSSLSSSSSATMEYDIEWDQQASMWPTLSGLLRVKRLAEAIDTFQVALVREMLEVLASDANEALSHAESIIASKAGFTVTKNKETSSTTLSSFPERLQALPPVFFLDVVTSVCKASTGILRRVGGLHDVIERVLDSQGGSAGSVGSGGMSSSNGSSIPSSTPSSSLSGAAQIERQQLAALSSGQVAVAVDTAQRRVASLLSTRREQSARMHVQDLRALWDVISSFNSSAAGVLARAGVGAGAGLMTAGGLSAPGAAAAAAAAAAALSRSSDECLQHAKGMLQHNHTRNLTVLSTMLDAETWKQAAVPRPVQAIADAITQAVSAAPSNAIIQKATTLAVTEQEAVDSYGQNLNSLAAAATQPGKTLVTGGQHFFVCGTGVMLVKMLGDYSSIAEAIPDIAGDSIQCTVQLLRHFNRSSSQLVLGAGALQTKANLKRITAKHLAVTSQTLGAVVALLPSIRALLLMRLPPQQHGLLSDLANVTADILAHDNRICAKFVAIVKDLVTKCLEDMRVLQWGNPEITFSSPSTPMQELTGGITTLHKILSSVFRQDQLADIYSRILVMLNGHLPSQCAALVSFLVMASQQAARAQMSRDGQASATALVSAAASRYQTQNQSIKFSRDIVLKRLSIDLQGFLTELRNLADSTVQVSNDSIPSEEHAIITSSSSSSSSSYSSSSSESNVSASASNLLGPGLDALGAMTTWLSNQFGDGKSATTSSSSSPLSSSSSSSAEEGDSALTVAIASVLSSDGVDNGENNREDNNGGGGDVISQILGDDEENVEIPNEEVFGDKTATAQIEKEAQLESIS